MLDSINHMALKELRVLRGYFGPATRLKIKVVFHQFLLISLYHLVLPRVAIV